MGVQAFWSFGQKPGCPGFSKPDLHVSLDQVAHHANAKGAFDVVQNILDATAQIADAQDFIDARLRRNSCRLFAYPYGHTNRYLVEDYFPNQNLVQAAFCTGGEYLTKNSSIWAIPRFVCQQDWCHPDQLADILLTAQSS